MRIQTNFASRTVLAGVMLASAAAMATTPLFDSLEYNGQRVALHEVGKGWLDMPRSPKVRELVLNERCSAIGGPRGRYRIEGGKLWLTGLHVCSGDVSLAYAYGKADPIEAVWVTGQLRADAGEPLCVPRNYPSYAVLERRIILQVEAGAVTSSKEESNADRPEVPKDLVPGTTPLCNEVRR
jgi:hypothetical protein